MKLRHFACAAIGLAALSFSSCSSENGITGEVNVVQNTQQLTFTFDIPKGDPITYATHDEAEYDIASLWMYEFDATSGKLLKAPVNIKDQLTGAGPTYSYSKTVTSVERGTRRFVFVANEQVSGIAVGSTLADLQATVANRTLGENVTSGVILNDFLGKKRIPMTGEAMANGTNVIALTESNPHISVEMTRIVARIDITNMVHDFQVTHAFLMNANRQSYLFLNGNYDSPASNTKVSKAATFTPISSAFTKGVELKKAFYLYEGVQPANKEDGLQILVQGRLHGTPVSFYVPFYKGDTPITVKRNHIYRLILKDENELNPAANTNITFSVEDEPWNAITLNEEFEAMAVIPEVSESKPFSYDAASGTATISNQAYEYFNIYAVDKLSNAWKLIIEFDSAVDWITVKAAHDQNTEFRIAANTTGRERRAEAKVYHINKPDVVRYVTIVQKP